MTRMMMMRTMTLMTSKSCLSRAVEYSPLVFAATRPGVAEATR